MARKYKTAEQRKKEIEELTDIRNKEVENYFRSPEDMKEYLSFMGKFYNYSMRNSILIQKQFPGAQAVGSFAFWKGQGFSVQKGEKGIKILAPIKYKTFERKRGDKVYNTSLKYATKEEKELIEKGEIPVKENLGYKTGYVFDVSQTNAKAKDLPKIFPNKWLDGEVENYEVMEKSLEKLANNMGVDVLKESPFEEMGVAKGAYIEYQQANSNGEMMNKKGIVLNPRNSELQNVKTLIHELAHAELHNSNTENSKKLNHNEKEFQAEMTAFTVCSYFNIDTSDYSLDYLHHYTKDEDSIDNKLDLLDEVKQTSQKFITHLEGDLVKEDTVTKDLISTNEDIQEVKDKLNDVQLIVDNQIISIGDLSEDDFQNYFSDKHNRNILTSNQFENMEKTEIIKAFNDLDDRWRKDSLNIKMIDNSVKEPQVYALWSETNVSHKMMSIQDMDKELAKRNIESLTDAGYNKTKLNLVIPNENGVRIEPLRVDLGDGYYHDLSDELKDYVPENQDYLKEIYTKEALTDSLGKTYYRNLELKSEHNKDENEIDLSDMSLKSVERFIKDNGILSQDEINNTKDEVQKDFLEKNEYKQTVNNMVNLQGQYEKYQGLLKKERTGDLTEDKVIDRLNAENSYNTKKENAINNLGIDKGIIDKMENDIKKQFNKNEQHEKTSPFTKEQVKNQGLSM